MEEIIIDQIGTLGRYVCADGERESSSLYRLQPDNRAILLHIELGYDARVSLHDYSSGATLASVVTSESRSASASDKKLSLFRYISVSPITLSAGFRGYFLLSVRKTEEEVEIDAEEDDDEEEGDEICISWRPHSSASSFVAGSYSFDNAEGRLFHFPRVVVRRQIDDFDELSTSIPRDAVATNAAFVSFRFRLGEEEVIEEMGNVDPLSNTERTMNSIESAWQERTLLDEQKLYEEATQFGDLMFVDVVDTYANLPKKLLLATRKLRETFNFDVLVKADDDVYLRIDSLFDILKGYGLLEDDNIDDDNNNNGRNQAKVYFGRFRRDWAVMRDGKWAEERFQGNGYPPFACGATYALSSGAAAWLSANAASLALYQGEDVSMGLWMSALGAEVIDDVRFACGKEDGEANEGVNMAELTAGEIRHEHQRTQASSELKTKLLQRQSSHTP